MLSYLSVANVLTLSLILSGTYFLLRIKNYIPIILPDDFMIALLAILAIIGAVYIQWINFRRDAVRTLL